MDGWVDGKNGMNRWMGGWVDGKNGRLNGWMDGWVGLWKEWDE